jgi:proteasome accessory factor C
MCGLPGYTPYELIEIFFDSGFVTINNHDALDIPRALTSLEVASLLIGLEILRESATATDAALVEKIDILIAELSGLIGESIEVEDSPQSSHRVLIEQAIAARRTLEVEYISPVRDEVTLRRIDPLYFERVGNLTYLVAHCHEQGAVRNYRLDRFQSVVATEIEYSPVNVETVGGDQKLALSMMATGSRRAIAELFAVGNIPQSGHFEVEVYSSEWAEKAVVAHSPDLTLKAPEELRQGVRQSLQNILALYAP